MTRALHENGSPQEPRRALLLFAKAPRAGRVKTRMEPRLGREGALALHQALLADGVERLQRLAGTADPILYLANPDEETRYPIPMRPQSGNELGERLRNAFAACLEESYDRILVIGIDSPMMQDSLVRDAFAALEDTPVVIGPCNDGGYYLLGISSDLETLASSTRPPLDALFLDFPFGGSDVLRLTLSRIRTMRVDHRLLVELPDLDRPEDLDKIEQALPRHTDSFLESLRP